ncbi:MAG TPA: toll/interleukin-1 receptor domain-containing protein [Rhizomicrobium sp.]
MILYDVFICHASEDKNDFARALAEALQSHHVEVWYDEFSLTVGDSLREAIDRGLASCRFGIVVLSPDFFQKRWSNRELSGLVAREIAEERRLILPVWHKVGRNDVLNFSPPLADVLATSSAYGMDRVVADLLRRIRPAESPLIVARDFLIEKGVTPPVVTDEWWLDIIETKQAEFAYPDLNHGWRWIFPLPFDSDRHGRERGLNIAWTALQLDWADAGKAQRICQLTHPDKVHSYLREWPGLQERASESAAILALYAPQLTIPGFDNGFADVFDDLLRPENAELTDAFRYGGPQTLDGKEPLCGDFIAWRHPSYGNYTPGELAYEFVTGHDGSYSRNVYDALPCLLWLLSSDSNWMPNGLRETLTRGFRHRTHWWISNLPLEDDAIQRALYGPRSRFAYTRSLRVALRNQIDGALHELSLEDGPDQLVAKFIEGGFLEGYHEEQTRMQEAQKRSNR